MTLVSLLLAAKRCLQSGHEQECLCLTWGLEPVSEVISQCPCCAESHHSISCVTQPMAHPVHPMASEVWREGQEVFCCGIAAVIAYSKMHLILPWSSLRSQRLPPFSHMLLRS